MASTPTTTRTQQGLLIAAVIGSLVLLNLIGLRFFTRLDVTRDRAYTLSPATKETMAALEEPVTITAYFTDQLPAPYASNARSVRDLLEELRAASRGKLAFEFIDPAGQETDQDKEAKREVKQDIFGRRFREPTSVEKELTQEGIQPVDIRVIEDDRQQTRRAYMGLVIRHQEKKEVIPLVQTVEGLEYDLTSLIRKLTRTKSPVIGVLQGHGEPGLQEKLRYLSTTLSQTYSVTPVTLSGEKFDSTLDALFVIGPKTALPVAEQKALDQFLMEGKAVALFLDSVQVDLEHFTPTPVQHGLEGLLQSYGVTVGKQLVADVASANVTISEQRGYMVIQRPTPYPFLPVVRRMEGDSPISKGLGEVLFPFATEVTAHTPAGAQAVVLAKSSQKSWLEPESPNLSPQRDWREERPTVTGPHPLMVQLSGSFKSHFGNESSPGGTPLVSESKSESRLVVAGTSALVQDDFVSKSRANQALLLNIADWLVLDPAMLAMRNRGMQLAALEPELPESTRNAVKFGNAFGIPLALALVGLVRWRLRERRRATVSV